MGIQYDIGLPEFKVLSRVETENDDYIYTVEAKDKPTVCPVCGSKLHIHKTTQRKIQDLREHDKRVGIIINSRRYRCSNKDCGENVGEEYPSIYSSGKMTVRLRNELKRESFFHTFKGLADEYGLSLSAVSQLFKEQATELRANYTIKAPKVLGIDELHLKKMYCGVIVDIEQKRIIELLNNRSKPTIVKFINSLNDKNNIKCVTMDMWRPYLDAVHTVLPKVPVVIDKFHVIKELNKELDAVRASISRTIQEKKERTSLKGNRFLLLAASENLSKSQNMQLQNLLLAYPQFSAPYDLKEAFRGIYLAETRKEAEELFEEWEELCDEKELKCYNNFINMVNNWRTEIFNYFDYPYTNAATESLNHTIREVDMAGRGYSFDVLRDKMVLQPLLTKRTGKIDFNAKEKAPSS